MKTYLANKFSDAFFVIEVLILIIRIPSNINSDEFYLKKDETKFISFERELSLYFVFFLSNKYISRLNLQLNIILINNKIL